MEIHERYRGNQYVNSKGKLVSFKGQVDLFGRGRPGESYLQFVVKKWMKLLDQKDIRGKLCIHDIDLVLEVTDAETMEMWLHELALKHHIPPDKIREHITKPCFPIEKFLRNGEEYNKMPSFISRCSSVAESSWFAKYYWVLDYVVQGQIVKGKGKPRAKPYTKEENRENWKATQNFKEYAERFPEVESVVAVMPGIPYHVRPENYKRWPSDEWVNGSVPCTCGAGELQHATFHYNYGDPPTETRIRYTCDCLQDEANYQESYARLERVLARNEKIRARKEQFRKELEDEAREVVRAAEAKRDEDFRAWQVQRRKKRAEERAKGKSVKYSASWDIYSRFYCKVEVPMQWDVYKQLETERYPTGT